MAISPPLNPDDLNIAAIDEFISELRKFIPEVKQQLDIVNTAINDVRQSKDHIIKDVLQQLDLVGQFGAVNDFWKDLYPQVGGIKTDLGNLVNSVETQVPGISRYVAICLYAIGGFFVLMTVIALLVCARLLFRGFILRLYLTSEVDGMLRPFRSATVYLFCI